MGAAVDISFRGRVGAFLGGSARLGKVVGPLAGGLVASGCGVRAVFGAQAALSLAIGVYAGRVMPHVEAAQEVGAACLAAPVAPPSWASVLRAQWRVLLTTCVFVLLLLSMRVARDLFLSLAGHVHGMSQGHVGLVASVSFLVDFLFFPLGGCMSDTLGRVPTGVASALLMCVGLLFLLEGSVACMVVFGMVCGLGNAVSSGIPLVLAADTAPAGGRSTYVSMFRTVSRLGDLVMPMLLGLLAHRFDLDTSVVAVVALGLVCAVWGPCCVTETLRKPPAGTTEPMLK